MRLRHGGLGGVPSFDHWDKRLASARTVKDFVSSLYYNVVNFLMLDIKQHSCVTTLPLCWCILLASMWCCRECETGRAMDVA